MTSCEKERRRLPIRDQQHMNSVAQEWISAYLELPVLEGSNSRSILELFIKEN
jgi:hypothetical protein